MITIAFIALIGIFTIKVIILLIMMIFKIIVAIWMLIEETKEKPSNFYLGIKEFSCSPEGERLVRNANAKKAVKARKRQKRRQNRQLRNAIVVRQCVKDYKKFIFGNNTRR